PFPAGRRRRTRVGARCLIRKGRINSMIGNRDFFFRTEAQKPAAVRATLARMWKHFRTYAHLLILVGVLIVVSTYIQVLIPDLMGQAVDCFLTPATISAFVQPAGTDGPRPAGATNCWYTSFNPRAATADY